MKCEKCGKNEASFFYSCNINGNKTEKHLCADCARDEGYESLLEHKPHSMFPSFGSTLRSMMAPVMSIPRISFVIGEPETAAVPEQSEQKIPEDAGEDIKARREAEALKQQLDEAVKEENFEKAIELRDKLRKLQK